jgi:hypothetical protein
MNALVESSRRWIKTAARENRPRHALRAWAGS